MLYQDDFKKQLDVALANHALTKPTDNAPPLEVKLYNSRRLGMRSTLIKTLWQKAREDPEVMKKVITHKECLDQVAGLCDVPEDISEADHAPGNLEPGHDGIVRGSDLSVGDKQKCADST